MDLFGSSDKSTSTLALLETVGLLNYRESKVGQYYIEAEMVMVVRSSVYDKDISLCRQSVRLIS